MNEKCTLYLVVPCYNEQEVLTETNRQLLEKMTSLMERGVIHEKSRILYVNDGSKDQTWILIRKFHGENVICSGLTLSRNRGHQNAVLAGLMYAKEHCDVAITLDADLQDDTMRSTRCWKNLKPEMMSFTECEAAGKRTRSLRKRQQKVFII